MFPWGALAGGLLAARGRGQKPTNMGVLLRLCAAIAAPMLLVAALFMAADHAWGPFLVALAAALAPTPFLWPEPLVVALVVPLRMPRLAWLLHRWGWSRASEDGVSRALLVATLALARQSRPSRRVVASLRRRLAGELDLVTTTLAVEGVLADVAGDPARARRFFHAVAEVRVPGTGRLGYVVAHDFLAADAASRGDWRRVLEIGRMGPVGATTRFLQSVARRILAPKSAGTFDVRLGWLLAPRRLAMWPILRLALDPPTIEPEAPGDALAVHRRALAPQGEPTPVALAAAVRGLDAMRSDAALAASVARRALALAVPVDGAAVRDALAGSMTDELARVVLDARLRTRDLPDGPTAEAVRERVREERLARLSELASELGRRRTERVDLPIADEWSALETLREATMDVWHDGDTAVHAVVHRTVYFPACDFAVRLSNVRGLRVLARHVFLWLGDLAQTVGTQAHRDLLAKNASACLSDKLPYVVDTPGEKLGLVPHALAGDGGVHPAAVVAAVSVVALATTFCLAATVHPVVGLAVMAELAAALVGSALALRWRRAFVDARHTLDGLVVQRSTGRWVVRYEDLTRVVCVPWPHVVLLHTRRAPGWLGHTLLVRARSYDEAKELASRLRRETDAARKAA